MYNSIKSSYFINYILREQEFGQVAAVTNWAQAVLSRKFKVVKTLLKGAESRIFLVIYMNYGGSTMYL